MADAFSPDILLAEHLQRLTERLAALHAQPEVLTTALDLACSALGAVSGAVLLLGASGQALTVEAVQGHGARTLWQDGSLTSGTPAGDAVAGRQPLYFEHEGALRAAYPGLDVHTGQVAVATAVVPMLQGDAVLGVLILDFREPHVFTVSERRFLGILAAQTAVALSRARLLAQQEAEAERFRRMVEFSPVGMAVNSPDGRLTLVNDAYLHLLGYTRAEYEAGVIDWQALTPPEYQEQDQRAFEVAFRQGVSTTYEKEMLTKTGERLALELTLIRYDPQQVVGYLKDLRLQKAQERLIDDQAETLREEQAASQAFMAFTEAASRSETIDQLGRLALETLRSVLPGSSAVFYDLTATHWQPRVWTDDLSPELLAALQRGVPLGTPVLSQLVQTGQPVFVDGWTAAGQSVPHSEQYQTVAVYPVTQQGELRAALSVGLGGQPGWSEEQRATVRALGRSFSLLYDRIATAGQVQVQKAEAEQRSQVLEAFAALSAELSVWQHPYELIVRAQEIVLSLLPEGHALYWEPVDGLWRVRAQAGTVGNPDLQAVLEAGIPLGQLPTIDRPWQTGEPEYQDRYTTGRDLPPELTGHVQSVAALPVFQGDTLRGVMNFTAHASHVWRAVDQVVLETVQQSLSVALDRLYQQQVAQQEQAALQAFVQFTTTVASSTDLRVLARAAAHTVRDVIGDALGGFYLVRGDRAYPVFLSDNTPAFLVVARQTGISLQLASMVNALQQRGTVFSGPALAREYSDGYASALSTRFYFRDGQPYAMFATATRRPDWTEQDRAVTVSVGQGLELALERLESAERVQRQRDEAASRASALEAFAVLSRDLVAETDRVLLVRQAQEIMLSLLTPGYALYWEQGEDRWVLKAQVGDIGDPALQRLVDEQGLPLDAPALHSTWLTGVPNYQDNYAQGADTPAEMIRHVQAATAFRVEVQGEAVGMLAIGLFDQRSWTPLDRAMLETAIYSLGLLLERARSFAALAERTAQLEAANGELEAFTYSVSHDLRTPVRHVKGFTELAEQALAHRPERAGQHLQVVKAAADRMTSMIDAMLSLSQVARADLKRQSVSLRELVEQAQRDAALEFPEQAVRWHVQALPTVQGDPDTLQQVFTNLLTNAVKYGQGRDELRVRVWAEHAPHEVLIRVQDDGAGFDPAYAHKLFGVFQRLHSQKEFGGTGIGLATVKRVVTRHGGRVWAEGKPGEGATFGFSLPT